MVSFNRLKRAQAAMEFLMTYGWAILVVLIVIGALAYFGVLSPSTLLPEKCTFPVSLSCLDHAVGNGFMAISLQNGAGRDITIRGVTATSEALGTGLMCSTKAVGGTGAAPLLADTCPVSNGVIGALAANNGCPNSQFRNGQSMTIVLNSNAGLGCTFVDTGRDKNRYNMTVFYSWSDSLTILHTLPGELLARKP